MNTYRFTRRDQESIWPVRVVKQPGFIIFCIILLLAFPGTAFCHQKRSSLHEIQDTLKSMPQSKHSVTGVSGYGNMLIPASVLSSSQSFYYGLLAYSYKNSLYFSTGSFHLEGYKPFLAFNSITSGYTQDITSWFDIDMSISRYQIPERLETVLYKSFFYGNFTMGVDWNVARTGLSVSSLFSQTSSIFYHIKNSRYFQTPELSKKKVHVSFEPYINIVLGTLLRISTSEGTYTRIKSPIRRWGNLSPESDSESGQDSGSGSGAGPGPGNDSGGASETGQGPAGGPGNNDPGTGNTDPGVGSGSGSGSGGNNNPGAGENGGSGDGYGDNSETGPGSEGSGSGTDAGQGPGSGTGSGKEYGQTGLNPETKSAAIATAFNQQTTGETSYPTIYKVSDFIGLMEIEAGVPIGFNTRRFIFEIEPGYVLPFYNDPEIPRQGGFSFMVNFYFKLF